MGHNLLARIPGGRRWDAVVGLLESSAPPEAIISEAAAAAERQMLQASSDPVFVESVRLLLGIPLAARSEDFTRALREIDIHVQYRPDLLDLLAAVTLRLDHVRSETGGSSDFGELAARALNTALARSIGDALPSLFGATSEDVRARARQLSWSKGISEFARGYFTELVSETLSYYLDRTLAMQMGDDGRFSDAAERGRFDIELRLFSNETSRIIQEFSGGWYGKTVHLKGGFGRADAAVFGAVALKKIVSELKGRRQADA